MISKFAWRAAAGVSGVLGIISLFFPIISVEAEAFGYDIASDELTLADLADLASSFGGSASDVYLLMALIGAGSIILLIGAVTQYVIAVIGSFVQSGGVGLLIYNLWSEGAFSSMSALGAELSASPSIGLFGLIIASIVGLSTLAM